MKRPDATRRAVLRERRRVLLMLAAYDFADDEDPIHAQGNRRIRAAREHLIDVWRAADRKARKRRTK